ncbi:MAG: tetratricopeptide repeat protein, partial [Bacteroidetes bacterium]|nr:tetratricopeptide repeat protein [Bacteroidota bacterium]
MKKGIKHWILLVVLFLTELTTFSQEDSLVFYFNRGNLKDHSSAERLLKKYSPKDSIKLFWVASKLSSKENKIKFYHAVGDKYYQLDDYETARFYYVRGLEFARRTLDKRLIADELAVVGDMFRLQDQNTPALNLLLQAMYLYKELGAQKELAHTLSLIGDLNRCIDQLEDALKYLTEGLSIAIKNNFEKDQTFCYSSIGGTYQAMKKYDQSLASYEKGLAIAVEAKDTMRIIDFYYSIGDLLLDQKELNKAIEYLNRGIVLCEIHKDLYYLAYCRIGLSKAFLKLNNAEGSIAEGLKAYKISQQMRVYGLSAEASEILYKAYSSKNDFPNAFKYL